ncbi:uncharacterized protein MYCGRDRAFT_102643 [Zymoseptoria tritici IPO323]|uniref:Uncharacterized protein n=1 Tax=Zymoseptoria tritici (strain CBS 115943 / IPO323) TaxID=336722 RepID=F9X0C7_ZYMTI|nr:uncharacterized protein MYCGRDRAFT_102643 [Zymoseptoria tritici IPO323]EGP91429.1 hypothetical protein MYCGRDRAFT_102643 [Zymoseptoria tritici IPO323]
MSHVVSLIGAGRFAELVARSMESQHIDIPSGQTMKEDVRRQRQHYHCLQEDKSLWNLACKHAVRQTASDGILDSGNDHISRPVTVSSIFDIAD